MPSRSSAGRLSILRRCGMDRAKLIAEILEMLDELGLISWQEETLRNHEDSATVRRTFPIECLTIPTDAFGE